WTYPSKLADLRIEIRQNPPFAGRGDGRRLVCAAPVRRPALRWCGTAGGGPAATYSRRPAGGAALAPDARVTTLDKREKERAKAMKERIVITALAKSSAFRVLLRLLVVLLALGEPVRAAVASAAATDERAPSTASSETQQPDPNLIWVCGYLQEKC